jgi:hypothetical protein
MSDSLRDGRLAVFLKKKIQSFGNQPRADVLRVVPPLLRLKGFTPQGAAQMSIAIGQLEANLRSNPCCIDPKLRDKVLDQLQPFGSGGITFVYKETTAASAASTFNLEHVLHVAFAHSEHPVV